MRFSRFGLHSCGLAVAGALAGCGGFGPMPPQGGAIGNSGIAQLDGGTWVAAGLGKQTVLYVSNGNGVVNVYEYWTHKLVGVLTKFTQPAGECVDKSGDVYIVDYQAKTISEYVHGGKKPIEVIQDSYQPLACSVDRTTGNLAVANYGETYADGEPAYEGDGNLAIYLHGKGKPTFYGARDDHFSACAYDDRGDLLASSSNGYSGYYYGEFDYLPKKSKNILSMNLPGPTSSSSSWQWGFIDGIAYDGKYWVVDDYDLYRYKINIKAEYVDKITLSGGSGAGGIAVYRKTLRSPATQIVSAIGYNSETKDVGYWKYPAGGDPYYEITTNLDAPDGVAISPRPQP
jgi:hypothetical protein